ncbi:probable RNA-binding protein 18 isoform X1 [Colias croceus]|uniref:probable RNA-binding protein 18 isoform X1 n=1 Tax=Colias crocea TaxID=72248 RepID=UPI001E2808E8|nr:probable RNA-binding protein 18 isoform X1 [Colias croceus]
MENTTIPLHLDPVKPMDVCDKRLWIGNLDTRVNEYQLLKMVRVYGNIEKFDMLFHRSGPNAGQPRGFAFVTYKLRQDAIQAMNSLNGQMLGNKRMCVKFAKNAAQEEDKPKPELGISALTAAKPELKLSKKTVIQSIEAKLKMMENMKAGDDFVINKLAAHEAPIITQYQSKNHQPNKTLTSFKRRHPYHKKR